MAFFDNLSEKMSQMGQKTKDFTEINRLKGLISDEERGISKLTAQIGEMYLKLHQDDPEEGLAELVASIKAAREKIDGYQGQIKGLRGVKKCPGCGAEVDPGVQFCTACGAAMPQPAPAAPAAPAANTVTCAACGAQVAEGSKFCKACGAPMAASAPVEAPAEPAAPAQPFTCPGCGAEYDEKPAFCTQCGQKL